MNESRKTREELASEVEELRLRLAELEKAVGKGRLAEEALKESEDRYRSVVESAGAGISVVQDDRFTFVNERLAEILGFPEKELLGELFLDFIHPDDREFLSKQAARRLSGKEPPGHFHYRAIRKDGTILWVELWGALIDFEGKPAMLTNIIDITDRKVAEQALRESEEKYRLNFENVSDVIYSVDLEFRIIDISPSVEAMLGYKPEEVVGKRFDELNLLAPECYELAFSNTMRLLKGHKNPPSEYEFIAKDGTRKIGEVISSAIIREGRVVSVLAVARDITDRKLAEQALEESEKRYRTVFDNSLIGIYVRTEEGIVLANRQLLEMLEYSMDEVRHMDFLDVLHPEDKERAAQAAAWSSAGQGQEGSGEFRALTKSGAVRWMDVRGRQIEYQGKPAVLTHVHDITDKMRMRRELQERDEQYRMLFETVGDVVYIMDRELVFISISPSIEVFLGYKPEEIIGHRLDQLNLLSPEYYAKAFQDISEIMAGETALPSEYEFIAKDGTRKLAEIRGAPLYEDGEAVAVIAVIRDVTEHRRLENQLFQAQKMESIGTLAGGIAHDFNNILGGILGYASFMKTKGGKEHPFFNYIDIIEKGAIRASDLTAQLLAFARGGKYDARPVSLNRIVDETLKLIGETFDRSIEIQTRLLAGLPTVEADEGQIQQALMNLCINAADAMPGGGTLSLGTAVEPLAEDPAQAKVEPGPYVVLSVTDTGQGIDKETMQRIFEPFFTTKELGKGTGLGLSMVYGVVKNHGGHVRVYSEPGEGTTFKIYLPASDRLEEAESASEEELLGGDELILVVDDEEPIRSLAKEILESFGYRVLLAEDGEVAVAIYAEKAAEIDLVILDMVMPKMGGHDTFIRLKEINAGIKAVLSTGFSRDEKAQAILDQGMMGYIQKPYLVNTMLSKVRSVLDSEE